MALSAAAKLSPTDQPLWVLASRSGFHPTVSRRAEREELLLLEPGDLFR